MGKAAKFELTFLKKEKMSRDAYSFYFDRRNLDFDFIPGQYLKLFLEIKNPDDRGTTRYFTISSSPSEKEYLTITTRVIKSSFKKKLNSLIPGEKITAYGPIGYFDFDLTQKYNSIFIAGGIGVTPYHSIINYFDYKNLKPNITLLTSFDLKENVVFFNEFKAIEKRNNSVKIIYTLTNQSELGFENGRINENLIKKYVRNITLSKFYITGPQVMVENLYSIIKNLNVSDEQIFKEDFPGY